MAFYCPISFEGQRASAPCGASSATVGLRSWNMNDAQVLVTLHCCAVLYFATVNQIVVRVRAVQFSVSVLVSVSGVGCVWSNHCHHDYTT